MLSKGISASSLQTSQPVIMRVRLLKSCRVDENYILFFGSGVEEVAGHFLLEPRFGGPNP
jgi:hypothetical protein